MSFILACQCALTVLQAVPLGSCWNVLHHPRRAGEIKDNARLGRTSLASAALFGRSRVWRVGRLVHTHARLEMPGLYFSLLVEKGCLMISA